MSKLVLDSANDLRRENKEALQAFTAVLKDFKEELKEDVNKLEGKIDGLEKESKANQKELEEKLTGVENKIDNSRLFVVVVVTFAVGLLGKEGFLITLLGKFLELFK